MDRTHAVVIVNGHWRQIRRGPQLSLLPSGGSIPPESANHIRTSSSNRIENMTGQTLLMEVPDTHVTDDVNDAWLESLRGDSTLQPVAEEIGIEFPEDSPPRFTGDLAEFNDV
jgi:hypothetical protein